jgi:hypothetical protein
MSREEALIEFLNGLRIALNNASAYQRNHPYFMKSTQDFKAKVDNLFTFISPIKISFAPDSLFLDGRSWQKPAFLVELAGMFHLRKIKSIELREGLAAEDLADFLSAIALPPREIIKEGGLGRILKDIDKEHFRVEELDYSGFLREVGKEETKDVWTQLFKDAIKEDDERKINEFADNLENIIKNFQVKDFCENEELRESLYNFLSYLKENRKEKFCQCSRAVFNHLLKYKEALYDERLDKIKSLFVNLDDNDYACIFWSGLLEDESFDSLNLNLFSNLIGEERKKGIAESILKSAPSRDYIKENPKAVKKIQDLLSVTGDQAVSDVYRNILSSLSRDISFEKGFSYDRNQLNVNYRYILLNMLAQEQHRKRLGLITERLAGAWEAVARDRDFIFVKDLSEILRRRKGESAFFASVFEGLEKQESSFLEEVIWEEAGAELANITEALTKSAHRADFYLHKIFVERKINPCALKLFLRLFPGELAAFYGQLEKNASDIEFLIRIVGTLKEIDLPIIPEVLKRIYFAFNELIKIEILQAMRQLPRLDEEFLQSVLKKGDVSLKKEALAALIRDPAARKRAIENICSVKSFWGTKNKAIMENLLILEEFDLKEASFYLTELSNLPFFWNRGIRNRARDILKRWH